MKFIPSRDLRIRPGAVWRDLKKERELVVTSNGQPVALMVPVTGEDFEEKVRAIRAARLGRTVRALQEDAKKKGMDKMTMDDINDIIAEARRERPR